MPYQPLQDPPALPETAFTFDAPPPPPTPAFAGEAKVDVAIIGGGITGVSAALHTAQAGARVALLEANAIGWGASGRNFGQMTPYLRRDPEVALRLLGAEAGERLIAAAAGAPTLIMELIRRHGIECNASQTGLLYAAHTPATLDRIAKRAAWWAARGAPVSVLDRDGIAEAIGGGRYWGGVIERRGGTLNPLAYCRGLARAAIEAGAAVHGDSRVLGLERAPGGGWRLTTAAGSLTADTVMLCTDSYSDDLWPGLRRALVFLRGYQLVSRPLPAEPLKTILPGGQAMTDTHRLMSGVRKLPGNRLQVSASVSLPGPERAMGTRDADRRLAALFPHLGPVEWERSWSGWIAMTADEFPRLQEPAPGLLIGYGYSGRGLALSTVMGRELARRATGTPLAELAFPGGSVRPIPMASLAPYGAAALLVLYRLQDRIEDAIYLRGAGTPRA